MLHAVGLLRGEMTLTAVGSGAFLLGTAWYAYLIIRRFQTDA